MKILLGADHRTDWVSTFPFHGADGWDGFGSPSQITSRGDVVIGSDVWIGANATILSGVSLAHDAVVGAGSIVVGDVTAYAVLVGNPARVVRKRFTEDAIRRLLDLEWWKLPPERINAIIPLLQSADVTKLIAAISPEE